MKAFVGVTDRDWFDFLSNQARTAEVDEVNFWMPSPWGGTFQALGVGQPLLFKLKTPWNAIVGGGFFSHYTDLPISLAWEAFGPKNGAPTLNDARNRILRLRRDEVAPWVDPTIGCILLAEPFFWDEEDWIPQPSDWRGQIVRGKTYDLRKNPGRALWDAISARLGRAIGRRAERVFEGSASDGFGGYGERTSHRPRIGQGIFSSIVRDAYGRSCAISRERALPALEAAHIRPLSEVREHSIRNGILLRSDVHRLFDAGYLTVTPDLQVEASSTMREDFNDGESYLALHGRRVHVPSPEGLQPDPDSLRWHNENRYRG